MAYEKYIKKDGKLYGPYIYHSKRVDGKVVSEYHGQKKFDFPDLSKYSKHFLIILAVFVLGFFAYFISNHALGLTGYSVLDFNANYQAGEPIDGKMKFSLQEGELVPADSKLVIDNNGKTFEFLLADLVSDSTEAGNFYVKGSTISGSGSGYGLVGQKETHPPVSFTLNILSQEVQPDQTETNTGATGTNEVTSSSTETTTTTETNPSTNEVVTMDTTTETNTVAAETSESTTATTTAETTPASIETTVEPTVTETTTESTATETGNVVEELTAIVANFFLSLTPTGHAIVESQSEVQGEVKAGEQFTYSLQEGQRVELKPRSVHTGDKQLDDGNINIEIVNGEAVVTTSYSESESGFGEDYLGSGRKDLIIDLSGLNIVLEEGDLNIGIVRQGTEIVSLSTTIKGEGEIKSTENATSLLEQSILNNTQNNTNNTVNETQMPAVINVTPLVPMTLTSQEKAVLDAEFGNVSVKAKEVREKNGFIIVRFELGKYWVENSYSSDLDNETLINYMQNDKVKWLKDLAKTLSYKEEPEKNITWFEGDLG